MRAIDVGKPVKLVLVGTLAALLLVPVAEAHKIWGATRKIAQDNVTGSTVEGFGLPREARVVSVRCVGMRKDGYFVRGNVGYYYHLTCSGALDTGHGFMLKYHQTARRNYTVTNVRIFRA